MYLLALLFVINAAATSDAVVVRGKSISDGYILPTHKQGYDEQRFLTTLTVNASFLTARTRILQSLFAPTVRKMNMFWYAPDYSFSENEKWS